MKNSLKIKRSGDFIGDVEILSWRYGEFIWRHWERLLLLLKKIKNIFSKNRGIISKYYLILVNVS
jgi:hypothetical protein